MLKTLQQTVILVLAGVCVALGLRAAQWAIPEPAQRVILCRMDVTETDVTCQSAAELIRRAARRNHSTINAQAVERPIPAA